MKSPGIGKQIRRLIERTLPFMIGCEEFEDFIVDYLEERLPRRQRIVFDLHLRVCPECRTYLALYQRTMAVAQTVEEEPVSEQLAEVPEELVKAVISARKAEESS